MPLRRQLELEQQFPDRFADAGAWLSIAESLLTLTEPHSQADISALHDAYESARLDAKYLSLAGIEQARERQNELARTIRTINDPQALWNTVSAYELLSQARKDPDDRLPWSRFAQKRDLYVRVSGIAFGGAGKSHILKPRKIR